MEAFPEQMQLQRLGCSVLAVVGHGGGDEVPTVILDAMRRFRDNDDLQEWAVHAIRMLCSKNLMMRTHFLRLHVLDDLKYALEQNLDSLPLVLNASRTLRALATMVIPPAEGSGSKSKPAFPTVMLRPEVIKSIRGKGIPATLVRALHLYPDCLALQSSTRVFLRELKTGGPGLLSELRQAGLLGSS
eukprot:PLAT4358.10.p1 GENE.PLAT4358.10~~PLAT4358.10.p1  ORF type:complete len:194 (-),score=83.62 PLAT4358.10:207-767(-)